MSSSMNMQVVMSLAPRLNYLDDSLSNLRMYGINMQNILEQEKRTEDLKRTRQVPMV